MRVHYAKNGDIVCMKSDLLQALQDTLHRRWCPSCGRERGEGAGLMIDGGVVAVVLECEPCEVTW